MVPDAELQLGVVIKALRDVVAPAVDPDNKLALEQLHLSIATVGLVQRGLPLAHARARQELLNALDLAEAVGAAGCPVETMPAQAALADPAANETRLDDARRAMLIAVEQAVADAAGTERETAVARAVIRASKPQCDLARAWSAPAGFEVEPDALPPLADLLARGSAAAP
ncbi:MAG: hypothetical protein V4579_08765 [Pseudomonadota bacterium]